MKVIHKKAELQQEIEQIKGQGKTIGFVPTMGALHAGHLALVSRCVKENDICVVSVFVNPTQFNNQADLEKYPRNIEKDAELLSGVGCDMVFVPSTDEMYDENELKQRFAFDFGGLDAVMEGKYRPGHFNGVVQVVSKLFRMVRPDRAYFGEKDFQQVAIIHRMVEIMNFPVEIVDCPIVREASGLALSSRNERLTDEQRKKAVKISEVLFESRNFANSKSPKELIQWVVEKVNSVDGLEVEYYEIVDDKTLQAVETWNGHCIGCITVFCGEVRLIDNIRYN